MDDFFPTVLWGHWGLREDKCFDIPFQGFVEIVDMAGKFHFASVECNKMSRKAVPEGKSRLDMPEWLINKTKREWEAKKKVAEADKAKTAKTEHEEETGTEGVGLEGDDAKEGKEIQDENHDETRASKRIKF